MHDGAVRQEAVNELLLKHQRSGSGKLALASLKGNKKALGRWGKVSTAASMVSMAVEMRTTSTLDALRRLEKVLDKIDGQPAKEEGRNFVRELEYILGSLNPIEIRLIEPFKRFEAGVNAIEEQLMQRDTASEEKLRVIREAITKALARGHELPWDWLVTARR